MAGKEAEVPGDVFILDQMLASGPAEETFTVPLGNKPDQVLTFRLESDFAQLQELKDAATERAKEAYDAFTGRKDGEKVSRRRMETITQCFLMASLSMDGSKVTAEKLYRFSCDFGAVFAGIVQLFSIGLSRSEAAALVGNIEDSKN